MSLRRTVAVVAAAAAVVLAGLPAATASAAVQAGSQARAVSPGRGSLIHVVRRGETLSWIARRYEVSLAAIVQANGIRNPNWIYAGQRLVIPVAAGAGRPAPAAPSPVAAPAPVASPAAAAASAPASSPAVVPLSAVSAAGLEALIIDAINGQRAAHGLAALRPDPALMALAAERSSDMAARGYFAHVTPEGRTVFDLIDGYRIHAPYAGENLGRGGDYGTLVGMWMESPSHRKNVLNQAYTRVGVSLAGGILTAVFGGG